jgi:hypothetical protein
MRALLEIDRILRGDASSAADLREKGLTLQLGQVIFANVLLAAFAGLCLGVFGIANREEPEFRFMVADAFKVPLLFLLSLVITFPSLYVFNALVGSPLRAGQIGRLMAAALTVVVAVLAAFGPILAFFAVTTTSYAFILLLNVAIFITAGGFGIDFLWRTMIKLTMRPAPSRPAVQRAADQTDGVEPVREAAAVETNLPAVAERGVNIVFRLWLLAFALVGAQTSWVLRPFIGAPDRDFTWFRPREASFFEAVAKAIHTLFVGS